MTYFRMIFWIGTVVLSIGSHAAEAVATCTGNSANLKCLKLHFNQLYSENYEHFWVVFNQSADEATQCRSINKTAEYLDLVRITTNNAEFNEAVAEVSEKICLHSPSCFKQANQLLDKETQRKLAFMMENPIFIDRDDLRKAGCLGPIKVDPAENVWAEFLGNPSRESHDVLVDKLTKCNDSSCRKTLLPSPSDMEKLLGLVKVVDLQAVDVAFLSLRFIEGGDLEDVYRGLGMLIESDPRFFLTQMKDHSVTEHQMRRLLRMLPLDTVDDIPKKIRLVRSRMDHLSEISDPALEDIKNKSIAILKQYQSKLNEASN